MPVRVTGWHDPSDVGQNTPPPVTTPVLMVVVAAITPRRLRTILPVVLVSNIGTYDSDTC